MSDTQELPLDLSAQYAAALAASAASASPQNDGESSGPRHRKENKMRRSRKSFSSFQVEQLKRQFQRNQYPNQKEAADLASSLGLTVFQVKTWSRNRRNINDVNLDSECKKMTAAEQEFGGGLGTLEVGGNTGLAAHPQLQEMGYYGQVQHNQLTSHHESEGGYHPHIQQQMEEAVAAAVNYVYYMTYISHCAAFMEQTNKGT